MGRPNGQTSHSRRVRVHQGGDKTLQGAGSKQGEQGNQKEKKKDLPANSPARQPRYLRPNQLKECDVLLAFLESFHPFVASVSPCPGLECPLTLHLTPIPITGKRTDRTRARVCEPCSPSLALASASGLCSPGSATCLSLPQSSDPAAATGTAGHIVVRAPALLFLEPGIPLSIKL